jgi:hypothetical protein
MDFGIMAELAFEARTDDPANQGNSAYEYIISCNSHNFSFEVPKSTKTLGKNLAKTPESPFRELN